MDKDEFIFELSKLNITLDSVKLLQLERFYKLLVEWNQKMNLTGITEKKEVYLKHFYDSLTLVKACDLTKDISLCDVGTGAGFPGIVLKICFPNLHVVLVDSLQKRILFLNHVISELGLENIQAYHSRMEDFSIKNKEVFDIITSRAVAKIPVLSEISGQALKVGGKFIWMKANCEEELENLDNLLSALNLSFDGKISFALPCENSQRTLVMMTKKREINPKYPRVIDKIRKNPL